MNIPEDDSEYLKTPYEKASHIILEATVDAQGNPWGKFGILNNQHGNTLKALLDVGHMPGVSTRGLGDTAKDDKSVYIPDENYALITWDIVRNPNFASLKMEKISDSVKTSPVFKELVEMYHLRDSYQDVPNLESDMKLAISSMKNQLEFMIQTLDKLNLKY